MSPNGTAFMARWWNEMPQYDGLYDNQGQVRPSYYTFKLLALLKGQQLTVVGTTSELKALAVKNDAGMQLVMWNFPASGHGDPEEVRLHFPAYKTGRVRIIRLNATSHFNQLEQEQQADLAASDTKPITFTLYPYEIRWLTISP